MRGSILWRLFDQLVWSGAFFIFNYVAASSLDVGSFAAVTVAMSAGVIAAACVRAYSIDGPVIAGSRSGLSAAQVISPRAIAWTGLVGAAGAAAATLSIVISRGSHGVVGLSLVAVAIVLADSPHYSLTMLKRYKEAASSGATYVLLASLVSGAVFLHFLNDVLLGWIAALVAVTCVGWANFPRQKVPKVTHSSAGIPVRLAAEAMYGAIAGQLGILIVFIISSPSDTAGIRLSYSLVFAPVFMIIQGLSPLLLTKLSELFVATRTKDMTRMATLWCAACSLTLILFGLGGTVLALTLWHGTNFENILPFLFPIGLSMLGNVVLDASLLVARFSVAASVPHKVRLIATSFDVSLQLSLTLIFGTGGLVWALILGFMIKISLTFMTTRLYRKQGRPINSREESVA